MSGFCADPINHADTWTQQSCPTCNMTVPEHTKKRKGVVVPNPLPTAVGAVINQVSRRMIRLIQARGQSCHYCKRACRLDVRPSHNLRATIDHVIPLADGGAKHGPNEVIACRRCNTDKADMTLEEWDDRWYEYNMTSAMVERMSG